MDELPFLHPTPEAQRSDSQENWRRSFLLETVELLNVEQNADNADNAVNAEIMQTYYR